MELCRLSVARCRSLIRNGCVCLILLAFVGCARLERNLADTPGPLRYEPTNIFAVSDLEEIRNVAVLPLRMEDQNRETVVRTEEVFWGQLRQTGRFDVTEISSAELLRRIGSSSLSVQEPFPEILLADLRDRTGIDAVLVTEISHYRPYRPIAVGVRARLFEIDTLRVLWECDEIFDAGMPSVAAAARAHSLGHSHQEFPLDSSTTVLHSPARFSKYVSATLFQTLPPRRVELTPIPSESFGGGR